MLWRNLHAPFLVTTAPGEWISEGFTRCSSIWVVFYNTILSGFPLLREDARVSIGTAFNAAHAKQWLTEHQNVFVRQDRPPRLSQPLAFHFHNRDAACNVARSVSRGVVATGKTSWIRFEVAF